MTNLGLPIACSYRFWFWFKVGTAMMPERHTDLGSRHRPAHKRHGPPRLNEHRALSRMRVARNKPPRRKPLQRERKLPRVISPSIPKRKPVEHTHPIGVDLQPPEAPKPRVAERTIIEIHRVLRRNDDANTKCARLFHQR